ncbi:glycosyltransferase [Moorena sp. SIO4G3]|uniref:glycosyltransferase n=1 Tax=Moorena sp. SIO4G3 TaxID=2607821 RepID=UPI00142CB72B|nr:glycosyltransferase [Moorena sp. SIO4G3]NEO79845.1 glycosyltransferase [Moorena sp. SIO4G3]
MSISIEKPLPQTEKAIGSYVIPSITLTEPSFLSLVIPTYNESKNIEKLIKVLSSLLTPVLQSNYELIVVDDDSPDRTWEVAQSLVKEYPHLRVIRRQQERGLATAVLCGWQIAAGNILGVIDGDLQHPPETLLKLLEAIENGVDLAVASRHIEAGGVSDWSIVRRILSRGAQILGLVILPGVISRLSDPMSGYFLVQRNAITECYVNPIGYKILIEVLARGRINQISEVGYVFQERQTGESKVTKQNYFDYLHHLLYLRLSLSKLSDLKQDLSFPFKRFMRFGVVGLSGVCVDMSLLYLLHDPARLDLGLTVSKIIAAEISIINNFTWNEIWTFGDISSRQDSWHQRWLRLIKFNAVCLLGLVFNVMILNLISNLLNINYLMANLVAIAVVTSWNFWINLKFNWRVTKC